MSHNRSGGVHDALTELNDELCTALGASTTADFNGIGHSWGLAAITSSEVAGSHYTDVISLAGAGEPLAWKAQEGTTYSPFSYRDALDMAQQTGRVWGGRNAGVSDEFAQYQYARPGDIDLVYAPNIGLLWPDPNEPTNGVLHTTVTPLENHNLIASDDAQNAEALRDLLRAVTR